MEENKNQIDEANAKSSVDCQVSEIFGGRIEMNTKTVAKELVEIFDKNGAFSYHTDLRKNWIVIENKETLELLAKEILDRQAKKSK